MVLELSQVTLIPFLTFSIFVAWMLRGSYHRRKEPPYVRNGRHICYESTYLKGVEVSLPRVLVHAG